MIYKNHRGLSLKRIVKNPHKLYGKNKDDFYHDHLIECRLFDNVYLVFIDIGFGEFVGYGFKSLIEALNFCDHLNNNNKIINGDGALNVPDKDFDSMREYIDGLKGISC